MMMPTTRILAENICRRNAKPRGWIRLRACDPAPGTAVFPCEGAAVIGRRTLRALLRRFPGALRAHTPPPSFRRKPESSRRRGAAGSAQSDEPPTGRLPCSTLADHDTPIRGSTHCRNQPLTWLLGPGCQRSRAYLLAY
jgi:hypothetical protein